MTLDSTVSGSGVRFLRNYLKKKRPATKTDKIEEQPRKPQASSVFSTSSFNCVPIPFSPQIPGSGHRGRVEIPGFNEEAHDDDGQSIGSTIAELLNETFDSDSDSELKCLDWDDQDDVEIDIIDDDDDEDEDDMSYAEYEDILCGVRRWMEANKGRYLYDVRKIFEFFDSLPPCHVQKSACFVPFICFLGTPLSPTRCGRHISTAPKEKEGDEEDEEGKTLIVGDPSPTEGLEELEDEDEEDRKRNRSAAAAARSLSSQLSRIMKGKSCNSSTHSSTTPAPSSTHILQPDRKCAVVNAFSTNATTQLSPSPRAPQFLTPPGYSDFTRQDPIQNSLRADKTHDPSGMGCNNIPLLASPQIQTEHILEDPQQLQQQQQQQQHQHHPRSTQEVSLNASHLSFGVGGQNEILDDTEVDEFSPVEDSFDEFEAEFKVKPVFGGDWPSSLTSTAAASNDTALPLNFPPESQLKFRDSNFKLRENKLKLPEIVPSSSVASLPGEIRRVNQSLADFWEERVGYKRSFSDGDKPAACSSFRPFNPTYYYYPESSRSRRINHFIDATRKAAMDLPGSGDKVKEFGAEVRQSSVHRLFTDV